MPKDKKNELDYELPEILFGDDDKFNGKAKVQHFQRFKLKPGTYIFFVGVSWMCCK